MANALYDMRVHYLVHQSPSGRFAVQRSAWQETERWLDCALTARLIVGALSLQTEDKTTYLDLNTLNFNHEAKMNTQSWNNPAFTSLHTPKNPVKQSLLSPQSTPFTPFAHIPIFGRDPSSDQPSACPTDFKTTKPAYQTLLAACTNQEIVFRIHDKTSISYLNWTGDPQSSGFSAPNPNLANLSPTTYHSVLRHNYRKDWASDTHSIQTMINHILCLHPVKHQLGNTHAADELSPWISVTQRLDRAIYEIIKRLASGEVELVRMTIIRRPAPNERLYGQNKTYPLHTQPWYSLNAARLDTGLQSWAVEKAKAKATDYFESLYYGRIFNDLIEADLVWTKDRLPFALPAKFWRPKQMPELSLPGWLGRLRWNGNEDDYETAAATMKVSFPHSTSWHEQPVHDWSWRWPLVPLNS